MILVRHELHACADRSELRREAFRVGDARGRDHAPPGERVQLPAPTRLHALEMTDPEPRRAHRRPLLAPAATQPAGEGVRGLRRRTFPGHDDEVGAAQGIPALAPRPRGQGPRRRRDAFGAHHHDIQVPPHTEQLVRVVQHEHPSALGARGDRSCYPIRVRHHDSLRHEPPMNEGLVPAITPQQDAGCAAARRAVGGDPGCERRLARAADGQIPDRDRRQGKAHGASAAVGRTQFHDRPIRARERDERQARHPGDRGTTPQPVYQPRRAQ